MAWSSLHQAWHVLLVMTMKYGGQKKYGVHIRHRLETTEFATLAKCCSIIMCCGGLQSGTCGAPGQQLKGQAADMLYVIVDQCCCHACFAFYSLLSDCIGNILY
jgi:hypothetical protein